MSKHLPKEIKYNYVMRYKNRENPTKLRLELMNKNLIDKKLMNSARANIFSWNRKSNEGGIDALESKSGFYCGDNKRRPKKKKEINYNDYTKEKLIEINRIQREFIEGLLKEKKSKKFKKIDEIKNNTIAGYVVITPILMLITIA